MRIKRIAGGGDGVGTLEDGRTVFVPRTAPGDLVRLGHLRLSKTYARAVVQELVEPSADRVEPACPHYTRDACGGCQLQHLSMAAQLAAKQAMIGEALRRIAKLEVEDPEVEPAAEAWGYRNKVTLAVAAGGKVIGFHREGRPGDLFDMQRCHIADPALMELWAGVRAHRSLLPAALLQLVLRLDREGGRHLIARVEGQAAWNGARELHAALVGRGLEVVLWWEPEGGAPRAVAGSGEAYPAAVFEQVHPAMGDRVRHWALDALGDMAGLRAWDLYAGVGETTRLLAERGARVESVELDARAVREAERRGPEGGVRRRVGRAEEVAGSLSAAEVVVTNPPRTGMDARVIDAIARAAPARVAYISCDPATLARDLARLMAQGREGWRPRIAALCGFDLFPQTAHVETVVLLEGGA